MRKAVWGEHLKHGCVRGEGWNALAYPTPLAGAQEAMEGDIAGRKQTSDNTVSTSVKPVIKQTVTGLENSVIYVLKEKGFLQACDYVAKEQGISADEAKPFVDDVQRRFDVRVKEMAPAKKSTI